MASKQPVLAIAMAAMLVSVGKADAGSRLDAGWEVLLSQAANLSLKIGVVDRYDSTPNGRERNDLNYTALLLWKL